MAKGLNAVACPALSLTLAFSLFDLTRPAWGETAAGSATPSATAEQPSAGQSSAVDAFDPIQEIVVTALKKETRVQTTPASVDAVTGDEMIKRGLSNVQDLAATVPGMSFGEIAGQAHIAIRGIGDDVVSIGGDPRVAFYQDGVYIARPAAQLGGLFDIARVEVLEGPQGTLYGRNATGGALNVISRLPTDELNGYANLSYGNYNDVTLDGAVGGRVAENLSARIAIHEENRDGFGENLIDGAGIDNKSDSGARCSLLWSPLDGLRFLTIADYSRENDNSGALHFFGQSNPNIPIRGLVLGGTAALDSRDIASDTTPRAINRMLGVNETITFDTAWASIKSISAYRHSRTDFLSDLDGTSVPLSYITNNENSRQLSEELQIDGNIGRLDWLVGGLYFHEGASDFTVAPFSLATVGGPLVLAQGYFTGGNLDTDAYAGYVRLSYHLTDKLTITAGGRYNSEEKSIHDEFQFDFSRPYSPANPVITAPPFPRSANVTFTSFDPSATLDYKLSDNVFAYASYTEGFKSGGFVVGVAQPPYKPETIKSYEVGIKTTSLNGHLTANLTGFHYDYTNLQVSEIVNTAILIENAASATIDGVEFKSSLGPYNGFSINGSVAYLDARYDKFFDTDPADPAAGVQNLAGKQLTQAPKLSLSGGIQQVWSLGKGYLRARADLNYVSRNYFTPFDERDLSQGAYVLGSGSVGFESAARWSLAAYVRNVGNEKALTQAYVPSALVGAPILGTFIPPRMYGIRVGYEF